jgi:tRNA(fMet)-specific endonuclease VapC
VGLILDTNFIIAAERETRRGVLGAANRFFAAHPTEELFITFAVAGEMASGQSMADRREWQRFCHSYEMLPWSMEIAWQYGEIYRQLQRRGRLIGANDLWIAAAALVHDMAVVTNNVDEFRRVEGLTAMAY